MKLIFDIGCNKGQNLKYFLDKADKVIAIEADPNLIEEINKKFYKEIAQKNLFIENKVVSNFNSEKKLPFYVSKINSVLSQFDEPENIKQFKTIKVKVFKISEIIKYYLNKLNIIKPYYIKIDAEHHDHIILLDILKEQIYPDYLSCEIHSPNVLNLILKSKYESFKIVECNKIGYTTKKINITDKKGNNKDIIFLPHTSGPFGDEILGDWIRKDDLISFFLIQGLGWKDIHCSLKKEKYNTKIKYIPTTHDPGFKYYLKKLYPSFIQMIKNRIKF